MNTFNNIFIIFSPCILGGVCSCQHPPPLHKESGIWSLFRNEHLSKDGIFIIRKTEHRIKVIAHFKGTTIKLYNLISRCWNMLCFKRCFLVIKKFSPVRSPLSSHFCGCKTSKLYPLLQTAHFVNLWETNIFTFKMTWLFKYWLLILDYFKRI